MPSFTLSSGNFHVDTTAETHQLSVHRLDIHRQALERNGVPPISDLGTLELAGSVVASPGVVHAPATTPAPFPFTFASPDAGPQPLPIGRPAITSRGSGRSPLLSTVRLAGSGGSAPGLVPMPVSVPTSEGGLAPGFVEAGRPAGGVFLDWGRLGTTAVGLSISESSPLTVAPLIALDIAYFVGQTVRLADNTVIALQWPHKYLTFIAEELIVGENVTFTYEHPAPREWPQSFERGHRPPTPRTPDPSRDLWEGQRGVDRPGEDVAEAAQDEDRHHRADDVENEEQRRGHPRGTGQDAHHAAGIHGHQQPADAAEVPLHPAQGPPADELAVHPGDGLVAVPAPEQEQERILEEPPAQAHHQVGDEVDAGGGEDQVAGRGVERQQEQGVGHHQGGRQGVADHGRGCHHGEGDGHQQDPATPGTARAPLLHRLRR